MQKYHNSAELRTRESWIRDSTTTTAPIRLLNWNDQLDEIQNEDPKNCPQVKNFSLGYKKKFNAEESKK